VINIGWWTNLSAIALRPISCFVPQKSSSLYVPLTKRLDLSLINKLPLSYRCASLLNKTCFHYPRIFLTIFHISSKISRAHINTNFFSAPSKILRLLVPIAVDLKKPKRGTALLNLLGSILRSSSAYPERRPA